MPIQLIEVDELTGGVSGLHFRGNGIDLTQFGTANVKRCSEVLWHDKLQLWYCEFRQGRLDGSVLLQEQVAYAAAAYAGHQLPVCVNMVPVDGDPTAYFSSYDEAVAAEIVVIQGHALLGEPLL